MSRVASPATRRPPRSPSLRASRWRNRLRIVAFLSPWLLGTGLFFIYPLVATGYFSLMKYDGFTPPEWTGLTNWDYVFNVYPYFWPALRNTLWLVFVVVTLPELAPLMASTRAPSMPPFVSRSVMKPVRVCVDAGGGVGNGGTSADPSAVESDVDVASR